MSRWTVHDRYGNEIYMTQDGTFAPNNFVITAWGTYIHRLDRLL